MINTSSLMADLLHHAEQCYPRECCGLIIEKTINKPEYFPCNNISTEEEDFILDPKDYAKCTGYNILGVFHSHPDASAQPSGADIQACNKGNIPWVILSYPGKEILTIYPDNKEQPYLGRRFLHGIEDCLSIVIDYYKRELGIEIFNYYREDDWWDKGQNLYLDLHEQEGFTLHQDGPEVHDIVLVCIRSEVPNHAAIYLGDGIILHHLPNRLSTRDSLVKWKSRIYGYLRYGKD